MTKNTSQCHKTHQFIFRVEEEVRFIKEIKLLLFFVEMGNCQSRLRCTADNSETTPPKTARSEKSANLEMNSRRPNPERFFPYSVSDRFNRINELREKERVGWREVQSMAAEKAEEASRVAIAGLKSTTKNVCDADPNHPSYAANNEAEKYTETATKPKNVDEETRKEFLRLLYRTAWKDVNQRIMKAQEVVLSGKKNEVKQGASTSAESPSCNVPSSDEWLLHHPCLFDAIGCSEVDSDDENYSQSAATGHAATSIKLKVFFKSEEPEEPSEEPEFDSISPVEKLQAEITENKPKERSTPNCSILFVSTDQPLATEGDDHRTKTSSRFSPGPSPCSNPRPGALTRVLRRRQNKSGEGLVSRSGSEADESALPPTLTPTPSPENRADSRGGLLRGVISRIAQRRSNRVHDITSPGKSQSSSNSAIHGNPKSSSDRTLQSTPQTSNRSSLTRAWLNILGRSSPHTSGKVTQILVRPYDESQDEDGRRLVPSPASVEHRSRVEVSSPPSRVRSSTSGIVTFEIEDDIEVCSFTSSPTFDARSAAGIGGGT